MTNRRIETAEELAALPVGTVLTASRPPRYRSLVAVSRPGVVHCRYGLIDADQAMGEFANLTVIHLPDEETPAIDPTGRP